MDEGRPLAVEYPKEQARCRELLEGYVSIGPSGMFGAAELRDLLNRADKAAAEQDMVAMIRCFQEMKECE